VRRVGGGEEAADPGRLDALSLGPEPAPPLDLGAELSRVAACAPPPQPPRRCSPPIRVCFLDKGAGRVSV